MSCHRHQRDEIPKRIRILQNKSRLFNATNLNIWKTTYIIPIAYTLYI